MIALYRQQQRLDELFERAKAINDIELQSHWSRYLCVLVSGFLENAVELCLAEYCKQRADETVANFVQTKLVAFQNPKMGPIIELFSCFNPAWRTHIESATSGKLTDSINSIVGNRHKIAHGDSVALSLGSLISYYDDALEVVEILKTTCGLQPGRS